MKKHSVTGKKKSGVIGAKKKGVKTFKKGARIMRVSEKSPEASKGRAWTASTDITGQAATSESRGPQLMFRPEPLVIRPAQRLVERIVLEPRATQGRSMSGAGPTTEPSTAEMVDAGLDAFAAMTQRLALTRTQEAAMLGVSPSTWERYRNRKSLSVLETRKEFVDRLRLLLLIYESAVQFASSEENAAMDLKFAGGAMDPANPALSILDAMMADTSTLDLDRLYHRVDSRIGAV